MSDVDNAIQPQAEWNPPGADMDFNDLFGGAGDDSGLPSTNNLQPVEPTTNSTEPVVDAGVTAPQADQPAPSNVDFILKTNTGTVYKTIDEAARGIEQKDQLIANLRQMVSAVTGEDPLGKKTGASSTTSSTQPSYLRDSRRYAQDLSEAAALGQKTNNWDRYRDVQLNMLAEYQNATLGPYMPAVQNVGKQQALDSVDKTIPGFKTFYGSDQYNKVMESRPRLANAIKMAESQPNLSEDLTELYQIANDASISLRMPELVKSQQTSSNPTTTVPRMPVQTRTMTAPAVMRDSSLGKDSNVTSGMTTSASRKALMAELEAKGVKDMAF